MSSRLAKQSLELLTATPSKKTEIVDTKKKIKLPKVNKGIKKVKYEMRYGVHKKTKLIQEEKRKRENPVGKLLFLLLDNMKRSSCCYYR